MLWIKSLHIVFMVSWFAGLFYLPRIFVYHAGHPDGPVHEQFCVMERKLYHFIMTPAMVLTVAFGVWMAIGQWEFYHTENWFRLKMLLVAALIGYHFYSGSLVKIFAAGQNRRPHQFYRLYNELPTVALIVAVILTVVQPFQSV